MSPRAILEGTEKKKGSYTSGNRTQIPW